MMHACDGCGKTIAFGGKKLGSLRFCSAKCAQNADTLLAVHNHSLTLPPEFVEDQARQVFDGPCPRCGRTNCSVDLHQAHWVWSALILTQWKSTGGLCCQSCGTKSRIYATLSSAFLGWWGFPWGLLVTPVQIGRNLIGLTKFTRSEPSSELVDHIRLQLAARDLAERHAAQTEEQEQVTGEAFS